MYLCHRCVFQSADNMSQFTNAHNSKMTLNHGHNAGEELGANAMSKTTIRKQYALCLHFLQSLLRKLQGSGL